MQRSLLLASLLLALLLGGPALALPQVQKFLDVEYVTGGVGDEEARYLAELARDFTLKILVTKDGKYFADVDIRILDAHGELVLEARTDGPLLYANLPPGRYTVIAEGFGEHFERKVSIRKGRQAYLVFRWPWVAEPPEPPAADEAG